MNFLHLVLIYFCIIAFNLFLIFIEPYLAFIVNFSGNRKEYVPAHLNAYITKRRHLNSHEFLFLMSFIFPILPLLIILFCYSVLFLDWIQMLIKRNDGIPFFGQLFLSLFGFRKKS